MKVYPAISPSPLTGGVGRLQQLYLTGGALLLYGPLGGSYFRPEGRFNQLAPVQRKVPGDKLTRKGSPNLKIPPYSP